MCFLSVDLRLQMLMDRLLLAIVSLMVFQIFEALYMNCELGSGVIRKASFLFDSKYKEYKDIGILYLSVLNVSMLRWYTYKLWTGQVIILNYLAISKPTNHKRLPT